MLVEPGSVTVRHGMSLADPPLSRTIGVALADGGVAVYFERGAPLPSRRTFRLRTSLGVRQGEIGTAISVPIVQGEVPLAHLCRPSGLAARWECSRRSTSSFNPAQKTRGSATIRSCSRSGVGARLPEKVEAVLLADLRRASQAVIERASVGSRNDPLSEWLEVGWVRTRYRRIEQMLGTAAAAASWSPYAFAYCKLGVLLSESPWGVRMRPLAYAVFSALHGDAVRFRDETHIQQQAHNMQVTAAA